MDYNENEYTFKNIVKTRTNRITHKVVAVKDNMGDILQDTGRVAKTVAEKALYVSFIGMGGLFAGVGLVSGDPKKEIIGITGGIISIMIGGTCLKNANEYMGAIEELSYVKDDIEKMISDFKFVDLCYPIPEKEGRSL